MPRIPTSAALQELAAVVREDVATAAWSNGLVAKREERLLDPFVRGAAGAARAAAGPGARVSVDDVAQAAVARAQSSWASFQGPAAQDRAQLSRAEVAAITAADPALGALTQRAVARLARLTEDPKAIVTSFFSRVSFPNRALHRGLPQGARVDARPGRPERADVPAPVLAAFDWWYRAENADWASASLHQARIGGVDVWATYLTTDGDDAYLELMDKDGAPLASGRAEAEHFRWDAFFGRGRLSDKLTTLSDVVQTKAEVDPAARAQAGQVPRDFAGALRLDDGALRTTGRDLDDVAAPALDAAPAHLRDAGVFALDIVWARTLRGRALAGEAMQLGPRGQGELVVGDWHNAKDGKDYVVADWRDAHGAPSTYYFERAPEGLHLAIEEALPVVDDAPGPPPFDGSPLSPDDPNA